MNSNNNLYLDEIEKELSGYGQDFATKGCGHIQPWASLEIILPLLAIIAWLAKTVLKTAIEQLIKNRLSKNDSDNTISTFEKKIAYLEREISYLQDDSIKTKERLNQLEQVCTDIIINLAKKDERYNSIYLSAGNTEDLENILNNFGLTKRKSRILVKLLEKPLLNLLRK